MPTRWRTLYELAELFQGLHARIERGTVTREEAEAELRETVGVDEHGKRWTVTLDGTWSEVAPGETPEGKAAAKAGAKKKKDGPAYAEPDTEALEAALAELDELVGLDAVKKQIKQLTALVRVRGLRIKAGLPVVEMSHHLVFKGNPGTGKTTVARLIGRIYAALRVVPKGHLVEVDRSMLVAEYVGHTALKTAKAFESAREGLLFIDEAYTLSRDAGTGSGFGQEAIDTLVKLMEDHRDDTVLVVAGYPFEMDTFIETNPGLRSRFSRTIVFPDFTDDELITIFTRMCKKGGYEPTPGARARVRELLEASGRGPGFGNARAVRTLFEQAITSQAERLASVKRPTKTQLKSLTARDIAPPLV